MRALVQRVAQARVTVDEAVTGEIDHGLLVLLGVTHDDDEATAHRVADKLVGLRVFEDGTGRMNVSCRDVGGALLVVPQFTLYGDASRGRRPSFVDAALPEVAEPLVDAVVARARGQGLEVATGMFGAHMQVSLVNDGPVTLLLEL